MCKHICMLYGRANLHLIKKVLSTYGPPLQIMLLCHKTYRPLPAMLLMTLACSIFLHLTFIGIRIFASFGRIAHSLCVCVVGTQCIEAAYC